MPTMTNPETGETKEISMEEFMKIMRSGNGSLQQVVTHADGTTSSTTLYGNVAEDGLDRSVNIFVDNDTFNAFIIRKVKKLTGEIEDPESEKNPGELYEMTVDFTDSAIMGILKATKEELSLNLYTRDERKATFDHLKQGSKSWKVNPDSTIEFSGADLQGEHKTESLYMLAFLEMRQFLRATGKLAELKKLGNCGSGVIIKATGQADDAKATIVRGRNRPDLPCNMFLLGEQMMRPYMDELFYDMLINEMSPEEMIAAAEAGDPDIMEHLAKAYLNGDDNFEQDFEKSTYWWEKLASTGNAIGQFNTGLHYAKGAGVERDFAKAAEWMKLAAENGDEDAPEVAALYAGANEALKKAEAGDPDAQAEVATLLMRIGGSLYQYGCDDDYAESFGWAQKAAAQGSLEGMYCLALCYEHGRGTMVNAKMAADTYEKAAKLGHAPSQWNYAVCYFNGIGREIDWTTAYTWAYQSADQGYELAINSLSLQGKTLDQVIETYKNAEREIKLERTQYNGRADNCENLRAGTRLKYKFSEENNHEVLELFHNNVSVGVLNIEPFSEVLALLRLDRIELGVSVLKCIPKSQRGSRARSADVDLLLEISEKKPETAEERAKRLAQEEAQRKAEEERKLREAEERKKAEEERKRREEKRKKEEEQFVDAERNRVRQEKINYCKEYSAWEEKTKEINKLRMDEIERSVSAERSSRIRMIEENYAAALKRASEKKEACMKKKAQAEAQLVTLGAFKFSEKSAAKSIIKEMEKEIKTAENELSQAQRNYSDAKAQLQARLDSERTVITQRIVNKYPMPERPIKPYYIDTSGVVTRPILIENQRICRDVLKFLASGRRYTIFELFEIMDKKGCFPSDMTPQRLSNLVTKLVAAGRLSRDIENRTAYIMFNEAGEGPEPGWENGAVDSAEKKVEVPNVGQDGQKALSKRQIENEALKLKILEFMTPGKAYSVFELLDVDGLLPTDITPQRVSALLSSAAEEGKVSIIEKGINRWFKKLE